MIKKIEVSNYHIRNGARGSSAFCPIALALWTRVPVGHLEISETGLCKLFEIYIPPWSGNTLRKSKASMLTILTFQLPEVAIAWLLKYDSTGQAEPFWFEVDIPNT